MGPADRRAHDIIRDHSRDSRAQQGEEGVLYADEAYKLIGASFEVYNRMGCGFLESVYQECLEIELCDRRIPFEAQKELKLQYRGQELKQKYIPDFVCYGKIIMEIKAVRDLTDEHRSQMLNYLHGTGLKLGILVNFGHHNRLEYERLALSRRDPVSEEREEMDRE